jgi:RNA polymerase sigma-70 factor, ECF subfamily
LAIGNWLTHRRLKARICALRPQLYRTAYAWCHDPAQADDLVQETVLRAISNLGTLKEEGAWKTWLYKIMANLHRDWLRRRREAVDIDGVELAGEDCPESNAERARTVRVVRAAVAALNPEQRKVLTLVDLEGFAYHEVSEILDVPIGTVMSRLSRARQQLKRLLLHEDPSAPPTLTLVRTPHGTEQAK